MSRGIRIDPVIGGGSLADDEVEWRQMIAEEAKRLNAKGGFRHSEEVMDS